ncbi:hypothetical protein G9A89_016199 [Geosiphon pyriformis]|nr:hypothetical protein G9A89_016199 [Geosiphon pyriformis]
MSIASEMVDSSAGLLSLEDISGADVKPMVFWGSEVGSVSSSVSSLSNVENMENMIAKEISYAESGEDDNMNKVMPKKTHIDNNTELVLLVLKFVESNQMMSAELHILEKQCFKPVKSFALDVNLSAVSGKTNSDKLISVKKIFYRINGFGKAFTFLKFLGIIKSFFTSELSLKKTRKLAIHEKIVVNNDVRQVNKLSNQVIVIKEISVDLPKSAVESVFSKFGKIVSIKIHLISLWQKAFVEFELSEVANLVTAK